MRTPAVVKLQILSDGCASFRHVGVGDVLRLIGTGNTSFAQMQTAGQFVRVGTYTGVVVSAGNVVYLQNTTVAQLNANDFAFV
jgi:hypothetical protein